MLAPEWFSSFPLVEGLNKDEWERGDYRSWKALMAEREGIEPTKDHNSPSTVLKTDVNNVYTTIKKPVAIL